MSDYYPSPDELRDAWINDYDPPVRSSETVEANTLQDRSRRCSGCNHDISEYAQGITLCAACEDERATCEWFDNLPKPPEPLPWIEAPKATDRHPFS